MKEVFQTKFGYPDGNCHAACLASIFELEIETIPNFGVGPSWYEKFTLWCIAKLGVQPIDIQINDEVFTPSGFHMINGPSKNGDFWHSVVGMDGKVFHDPYPGGALKTPTSYTLFIKVIQ